MRNKILIGLASVLVLLNTAKAQDDKKKEQEKKIAWISSIEKKLDDVLKLAKENGKSIMIYFWGHWSKQMDESILSSKRVIESSLKLTTYSCNGRTSNCGLHCRVNHDEADAVHEKFDVKEKDHPKIIFVDSNGKTIDTSKLAEENPIIQIEKVLNKYNTLQQEKDIEKIAEFLKDDDDGIQACAILKLQRYAVSSNDEKKEKARKYALDIAKFLKFECLANRYAIFFIASIRAKEYAKDIASFLKGPFKLTAMEALANLEAYEYAPEILEIFANQVANEEHSTRFYIGILLVRMGPGIKKYAKNIAPLLKHKDKMSYNEQTVRSQAAEILAAMGAKEYAKEIADRLLEDVDRYFRERTSMLYSLVKLDPNCAKDVATKLLNDKSEGVRIEARLILKRLKK